MNETINNLITRRSVRSFQKEQISEEQLNEILQPQEWDVNLQLW